MLNVKSHTRNVNFFCNSQNWLNKLNTNAAGPVFSAEFLRSGICSSNISKLECLFIRNVSVKVMIQRTAIKAMLLATTINDSINGQPGVTRLQNCSPFPIGN